MNTNVPGINITIGGLLARTALIVLVILWTLPTFGLFVSSLRDKDQLIVSGWWSALSTSQESEQGRTATSDVEVERDGTYVIAGNIFGENTSKSVDTYGGGFLPDTDDVEYAENEQVGIRDYQAGETVDLGDGVTFTLNTDGSYEWVSPIPLEEGRGKRFFVITTIPPTFSLQNYREVLDSEGFGQAFINTFTVTIPATIIPIAVAAFAAYAFSWMEFPGRQLLFVIVIGLLVVPLQMSLIPLLRLYNSIGEFFGVAAKSYPGIWLAHTGFGLPLAIYLLRNYIGGLPREIIESAKIDGASHFDIFVRLILPLSIPALASFAIFQFLWVWNDLLVALVFLGKTDDQIVMTSKLRELLGSRGANWEILTSSAFISILVPLLVFFSLQRYFVRGLLAGSVKGG
ncbi:MAG: carbohydrate ABC transporter permease [Anaerolineae bacterium]|nr:carbohydrate ABC transporter permease [Anaerolineae bacterium]